MIPVRPLYLPAANLNGSDPATMSRSWREVIDALRLVEDELRDVRPHGRDYQTLGVNTAAAFQTSREQHDRIERAVHNMSEFAKAHALYWADAADARAQRNKV